MTGSEQEDLKRCQEAIQLTWLLVSDDHDDILDYRGDFGIKMMRYDTIHQGTLGSNYLVSFQKTAKR